VEEAFRFGHGKSAAVLLIPWRFWQLVLRMVPSWAAGAGTGVPLFFPAVEKLKEFALGGMVPSPTPTRDHGDPQSVGFEAQVKKEAGAGGGT
jgi:hypothetical protein